MPLLTELPLCALNRQIVYVIPFHRTWFLVRLSQFAPLSGVECDSSPDSSNYGRVISIYVEATNLGGTLPISLGNFEKIVRLGFPACNITGTIPDTISALRLLKWLHLHENSLSGTIPSGFGRLKFVEKLQLQKNLLSGRD